MVKVLDRGGSGRTVRGTTVVGVGGEVVIERYGTPMARLVAIEPCTPKSSFDRDRTLFADHVDDPLPDLAPYS